MLALVASIDSQAPEQDNRDGLVGGQSTREPRRRFARHDRAGSECVVADDVWICVGRDEHARATAAMALEGVPTQPFIQREHPTAKAPGAMSFL